MEKRFLSQSLTTEQAVKLLEQNGANVTPKGGKKTFVHKFFSQFADLMIVILLIAAALSFFVAIRSGQQSELVEPIVILVIVVSNALLGAFQEYRAEKSLDALQKLSMPKTKVVRDGQVVVVDSDAIVCSDICLFNCGDVVTADCKLLDAESLFVDQSALTGESLPVEKSLLDKTVKDSNTIYSGSFVTKGKCVAKVIATGANTELGKIASILQSGKTVLTPLQKKLKQLSSTIGIVCVVVCVAVFVLGLVKGIRSMSQADSLTQVFVDVFLTSVSLAVAAIPEGLPAVVTVVLANGIQKMASKNAIVKRLTAVDSLGCATVICSDKTGTITQNKMTLTAVYDGFNTFTCTKLSQASTLISQYCWCCDVSVSGNNYIGDPTEVAVYSIAKNVAQPQRVFAIPFDSTRKLMTVVVKDKDCLFAVTKGSLESMKKACNYSKFTAKANQFAAKGYRVLALSVVKVGNDFPRSTKLENNLNIVALFALVDPPKQGVLQSVNLCKSAGIRPVMLTGDNLLTAKEIASQVGIYTQESLTIDGDTLRSYTKDELASKVGQISVFARVTPQDKLTIVSALQAQGQVVAMTGDGVNDAPALKWADIGCAMGSGTEVAKDASDIVLADDNFCTIVDAVSVGRTTFDNIKKSILYLVTCNIGEVLCVFFALLLFNVSSLSAMQLLWINLATDGLPALALGTYKAETDVMNRPPLSQKQGFLGKDTFKMVVCGFCFGLASLCGYAIGNTISPQAGSTMAFLVLSLSQLIFALQKRSSGGLFSCGITKLMLGCFCLSVALTFVVCLVPLFQQLFGLCTLTVGGYLLSLVLAFVPSLVAELFPKVAKNS